MGVVTGTAEYRMPNAHDPRVRALLECMMHPREIEKLREQIKHPWTEPDYSTVIPLLDGIINEWPSST